MRPGADQEVQRSAFLPQPGKNLQPCQLAEPPPEAIPLDDGPSMPRNHEPETRKRPWRGCDEHLQGPGPESSALPEETADLIATPDAG